MSEYQAIARKWRPQTLQDLVGQEHIAQTLLNALKSGRVPHALLFTGPRGTGKTSTARILAKSLRCPNAKDFVPCGKCQDCVDIANGRSIDVVEIDGASNNGVDSVRELRESVGYLPSSGHYKVYIVDEVHMLSTSAFNALLKTLEEPPKHVIFILATTEVQKIPTTILSRCQRFDFRMITQKEISRHLGVICKADKVKCEEAALWMIAKQAKGSMRDSQSILDQIITFSGGDVTASTVSANLGLIQRELINRALKAIVQKSIGELSDVVGHYNRSGSDPVLFVEDLLEQLRNALMIKIRAHEMNVPLDIPDSEIQFLQKLVGTLSEEDIHLLFDITLKGSQNLVRATEPRLVLEMLLFKLASAPKITDLAQLLQSNSGPITARPQPPAMAAPARAATTAAPGARPEPVPEVISANLPSDPWQRFVESVRQSNGLLAALIEHTFIIERTPESLKLGLPDKMAFLIDKLRDPKNLERLQIFLESFWKETPKIEVILAKQATTVAQPQTPKEKMQKADSNKKQKERQQVEDHPLVKKAQSLFKSEIVSIKEEKP